MSPERNGRRSEPLQCLEYVRSTYPCLLHGNAGGCPGAAGESLDRQDLGRPRLHVRYDERFHARALPSRRPARQAETRRLDREAGLLPLLTRFREAGVLLGSARDSHRWPQAFPHSPQGGDALSRSRWFLA